MANKTTNFGLTKPTPEEFYDVGVQNANMDIIDEELNNRVSSIAKFYSHSADDLTIPFAKIMLGTDLNAELYKLFNVSLAWIHTFFYNDDVLNTTDKMQIATTNVRNAMQPKMAYRIHKSNGWGKWCEIARNTVMQVDDTTTGLSIPLSQIRNNTEHRFLYSEGLTHVTLPVDNTIPFEVDTEFHMTLIFKSGATATTINNTAGVYFTGDDCDGGVLTPVANKVYELGIWWNGLSFQGVVRGV